MVGKTSTNTAAAASTPTTDAEQSMSPASTVDTCVKVHEPGPVFVPATLGSCLALKKRSK
jgi:hypothetical protein